MPNRAVMWLCAALFLLATMLNVRELLPVPNPSWKVILAPVSSACMTLFAVIEAARAVDDAKLKSVSLVLVTMAAVMSLGRWFI